MLNIIVAIDNNNGIGYKGKLLYSIESDLKRFKELTNDNIVIMGRKTWDNLPEKNKPLPNRQNIILTKNQNFEVCDYQNGDIYVYNDFEELFSTILTNEYNNRWDVDETIFWVIGGKEIYDLFLPYVDKLYVTRIYSTFEADTFFTIPNGFYIESHNYIDNDGEIPYAFEIYQNKKRKNFKNGNDSKK